MRRSSINTLGAALGGTAIGLAGASAAILAARRGLAAKLPGVARQARHVPSDAAAYHELLAGVKQSILWGDPDRGAHGCFIQFDPGVRHPLHTHPNDMVLVVLSGAYLYFTAETATRVEAGSFFFIPAGLAHTSGGDDTHGALFYQESPGRFGIDFLD